MELERLDKLHDSLWLLATSGDVAALDRILHIMERRSKLLGLDSPTKFAPTDPSGDNPYLGFSDDALREALAKAAANLSSKEGK